MRKNNKVQPFYTNIEIPEDRIIEVRRLFPKPLLPGVQIVSGSKDGVCVFNFRAITVKSIKFCKGLVTQVQKVAER